MERKTICVTNLFLDLDNFRFEHQNSQRDAINQMVEAYHDELYRKSPLARMAVPI